MTSYCKRYQLKDQAKDRLRGNYKASILVSLLNVVLPGLITMTMDFFVNPFLPKVDMSNGFSVTTLLPYYGISNLFSFLLSSVLGIFGLGNALYYLKLACDRPRSVQDLFYGFRQDTGKALTVSIVKVLLNMICTVPSRFLLECYLLTGNTVWLYRTLIAAVIGYGIYLPIALSLEFSYYLMLDFPNKSAGEILALSCRIMNGHKIRLFLLECSFIPLALLGVCSFYVGFLWIIPYMQMTTAFFFLDMMNPPS